MAESAPRVLRRPPSSDELVSPQARHLTPATLWEIVTHLVRREIEAAHRNTLLGWAWPLMRQLAQLATLVFIFSSVIDLGIDHFAVFVFSGLVAWTWFSTGVSASARTILDQRHLVFQPQFPSAALPIVAISVPVIDVLLALPVLLLLVGLETGLQWSAFAVAPLIVLQFALMAGLAWLLSSATVFFRDVPNLTLVALQVLFYMTPVFYGLRTVPDKYATLLSYNPMAVVIEGQRAALLGEPWPSWPHFAYVAGLSLVLIGAGYALFRRLSRDFVDSL